MKDLISVIIPIYNCESYLKKCISSVINQTYKNIEIILVLDGPKDSSKDIAYEYKNKDDRIVIIDRENKGALYSRLEGVKKSKGKYITFIDSDDYIDEKYIEVLYNNITKYNSDIVRCHYKILKNNKFINEKLIVNEDTLFLKDENYDYVYKKIYNSIYFNSMCRQLIKRSLFYNDDLENVETSINYGEDILFQIDLINRSKSMLIIKDYLYIYNQNDNSVTFTNDLNTIYKKFDSVCKVNYSMYENISNIESNIKDELYRLCTVKFLFNIFNQYINIVKAKGDKNYIKNFYGNNKYLEIFKNNISNNALNNYNLFYKIGIKKVAKRKINSLYIYIKFIIIPLLNLKK